jgi:hypothetical protein
MIGIWKDGRERGSVLLMDSHVYEGVRRLTWTSISFSGVQKSSPSQSSRGFEGYRRKEAWLGIVLRSVVHNICILIL